MTITEFSETLWHYGMKVKIRSGVFKYKEFDVVTVDFDQALVACRAYDDEEIAWFRCENCQLI